MISCVIATFGSDEWRDLAMSRAYPSAFEQAQTFVVHHPDGTLATARNEGARQEKCSSHLCFVDADDELTLGYITAMNEALKREVEDAVSDELRAIPAAHWRPRLFTPAIQYVGAGGREEPPMFHPEVPIDVGNWLVIGTVVPRALFLDVGGFREWPIYEDYDLFARMQKAGASVVKVPAAVYRAHRSPQGRNHGLGPNGKIYWHQRIAHDIWPELYDATTDEEDERGTLLAQGRPVRRLRRLLAMDGST